MKNYVIGAAIILFILHQDFWFWDNATLVFGFLPIGLAYHAFYSLLAGALWAFAVVYAWPTEIEQEVEESLKAKKESAT
jgi:hypothetical protein